MLIRMYGFRLLSPSCVSFSSDQLLGALVEFLSQWGKQLSWQSLLLCCKICTSLTWAIARAYVSSEYKTSDIHSEGNLHVLLGLILPENFIIVVHV